MNNPAPAQNENAQPQEDAWTIKRILDWTTNFLREKESDNPRLEAEVLLAFACSCQRIQLYTRYHEVLDDTTRARMRELVKRRANSEPVAYLVGFREFFSLDFRVTSDVLIPRPETETLVLELIEEARTKNKTTILDLCTGSGCIVVSAAVNLPSSNFVAVDISEDALEIAKENAATHEVVDRIDFLQGDLFESIDASMQFDIIASNPPYISPEEIETLIPDVKDHEPKLALDGGDLGLEIVNRLIDQIHTYLKPGGLFLCEISPEQWPQVQAKINSTNRFESVKIVNDLAGRERIVYARSK